MDAIFMNYGNSKTFDSHWLLLNLSNKKTLKRSDKYVISSNISFVYYTWKKIKTSYKTKKCKISAAI